MKNLLSPTVQCTELLKDVIKLFKRLGFRTGCRATLAISEGKVIAKIASVLFDHPLSLRLAAVVVGAPFEMFAIQTHMQIAPATWALVVTGCKCIRAQI